MKFELGEKVVVNKDGLLGIRKGRVGVIAKYNLIYDNYEVDFGDYYEPDIHTIAYEHLNSLDSPKFKKGDLVKVHTNCVPSDSIWRVEKYFDEHNSYKLYKMNQVHNCVTSTTINLKEEKLERYEMKKNSEVYETAKHMVKVIEDFNREVNKAGGMSWSIEHLEKVSGLDLLLHLAPNDVKMRYMK